MKLQEIALCLAVGGVLSLAACATPKKTETTSTTTTAAMTLETAGDRVFFDYDRYDLKEEGRATLQRQAEWLKANPQVTVTIEGHCDERGTREYNLALGNRRATAAKDHLVSLGVDAARVSTISYGKERPVCVESAESCWSTNRRAVTVATKAGA